MKVHQRKCSVSRKAVHRMSKLNLTFPNCRDPVSPGYIPPNGKPVLRGIFSFVVQFQITTSPSHLSQANEVLRENGEIIGGRPTEYQAKSSEKKKKKRKNKIETLSHTSKRMAYEIGARPCSKRHATFDPQLRWNIPRVARASRKPRNRARYSFPSPSDLGLLSYFPDNVMDITVTIDFTLKSYFNMIERSRYARLKFAR